MLALSASDPFGLPGTGDEDDAMAMLRELSGYLDFDAGGGWGGSPEIDWERTRFASNDDTQLFVNETGSDVYRPPTDCREPGATCPSPATSTDNRIGMTTIESAVTSGLEAAQAIVARRGGRRVEIHEPRALPSALWVWLRYACMPYAAGASVVVALHGRCCSRLSAERAAGLRRRARSSGSGSSANSPASARAESAIPSRTRLGVVELLAARRGQAGEPLRVVVVDREQCADLRVADRQRRRQREDAVADVLLPAAAERLEPALVADVVAAVVEHAEQVPVLAQAL